MYSIVFSTKLTARTINKWNGQNFCPRCVPRDGGLAAGGRRLEQEDEQQDKEADNKARQEAMQELKATLGGVSKQMSRHV